MDMNFGQAMAQTIATLLSLGLFAGVLWYVNRVRKQAVALIRANGELTVLGAVWKILQTDIWPLVAVPLIVLIVLKLTLPLTERVVAENAGQSRSGQTVVGILDNPLEKLPILGWIFKNIPNFSLLGGSSAQEGVPDQGGSVYVPPDQSGGGQVVPTTQPTAAPPPGYVDEVSQELKVGDDLLRAVFANAQNSASPSTIPTGWLVTVDRETGFWIFETNRYWIRVVESPGANFVGSRIEIRSRQVGGDWWNLLQDYPKVDGKRLMEGTGMNWPPEPADCPSCFTTETVRVPVESGSTEPPPTESPTPPPTTAAPPPAGPTPTLTPTPEPSTEGGCPSGFAPTGVWPEGTLHSNGTMVCCGGKWITGRSCP